MSFKKFTDLPLSKESIANLNQMGYEKPTDVQAEALPAIFEGRDVLAQSKTGSGKTAAFSLNMVEKLNARFFGCQGLVLCPTRELATQVAEEIRKFARYRDNIKVLTLCGGAPIGPQIGSLEKGAHIIVGTPGRIADHMRKRTLDISQVQTLVLDEADRMLDMGFYDQMMDIRKAIQNDCQTLLFSATFPEAIEEVSHRIQQDPVVVKIENTQAKIKIDQVFYKIEKGMRNKGLLSALAKHHKEQTIVFCNTKNAVDEVWELLKGNGYIVQGLHGDFEQKQRDMAITKFANRSLSVLVATDVAARGIDIDDLELVVNYDLPKDPEVYVHRIGRTGRGEKFGIAISLYLGSQKYLYDKINALVKPSSPEIKDLKILEDIPKPKKSPMVSVLLDSGKKHKLRAGDILGALTKDLQIPGSSVGKIKIFPFVSYVALDRGVAKAALEGLKQTKIKGRMIRAKRV